MRQISIAGVLLLFASGPALGQSPAPLAPRLELRIAAPLSPAAGMLAGAGVGVRAGWYARVGLGASAGAVRRDGGWIERQQIDLTARFLFDPYAERQVGFYGGAGLGLSREGSVSSRGELLFLVGAEGPARRRLVPALEVVVGGGVRLQGVLRVGRAVGR
jgi:hypothetical protein